MLAIAGGKGGCGKTTTALGLASALAARGARPLVVDADPDMPDIHHVVGLDHDEGIDAVARGTSVERAHRQPSALPGVAVLTAGSREHYAQALDALTGWSGPVILDCPAGASPDAIRPLRHATEALVVTTGAPQCLEDATRTATAARQLGVDVVGTVVRERPRSNTVSAEIADSVPPVCARLPTVDADPLADSRTQAVWTQLATSISTR
jgi:septum site-determining protein MinD